MNEVFVLMRYNNYPSNDYWIPVVSKNEKDLWNWIENEYKYAIGKVDPEMFITYIDRNSFSFFTHPGGTNNVSISIRYEIIKANMIGESDE